MEYKDLTKEDALRIAKSPCDVYKPPEADKSEAELFGTSQLPCPTEPLPAKNLKSVGG